MTEKMFDLTGKVALVTGANSGLGFAFAEGMARAGSDLVIWGRRKDANDKAAEKLRAFGVKVHSAEVDVTDEAQIVAGVADALAAMGRIDTVVANAGVASRVPFTDMDVATYRKLIDVNLDGAVFTLREGARHMKARALTATGRQHHHVARHAGGMDTARTQGHHASPTLCALT